MAAQVRAAQARVDWIKPCPEDNDLTPALAGWRVGLAAAVVAAVLVLSALPVVVLLEPSHAIQVAGWLGRLAGVIPVLAMLRALVVVVAVVVIARSDERP